MGSEIIKQIEEKQNAAVSVGRVAVATNPGQILRNFNYKTLARRFGNQQDECRRSITVVEFTTDFLAAGFANPRNARLFTDHVLSLNELVEENRLPEKPVSPLQIWKEIENLLTDFPESALSNDPEQARQLAILIKQKADELVKSTHNRGAFCLNVV